MIKRVYTAVIRDDRVLMVRHVHDGRDYWTLPGGRIEEGETPEAAAIREVIEETGVELPGVTELFREEFGICFVARLSHDVDIIVGIDPELDKDSQMIRDVKWFPIAEKRNDLQVSKVLERVEGPY